MEIRVPSGLVDATLLRVGESGRDWLDRLPKIVIAACEQWGCTVDGDPRHGQVALVVPVQHRRGPAVLKASFPHQGNGGEAAALRAFGGRGAVELLEADEAGSVLVEERAHLRTLAEEIDAAEDFPLEEAVEAAGELARMLAVSPGPGIVSLASSAPDWAEQLRSQAAACPDALPGWVIGRAVATIDHLAADRTPTMIHGDLHFGNILSSDRTPWLAIDPKGWSGTAAFDAFTVVAGRTGDLGTFIAMTRRFAAAARIDPDLALACCQARAVSSYLYQQLVDGTWFDAAFLRDLAAGLGQPIS